MAKSTSRIIAFFLVHCLVVDPALSAAEGLTRPFHSHASPQALQDLFTKEALQIEGAGHDADPIAAARQASIAADRLAQGFFGGERAGEPAGDLASALQSAEVAYLHIQFNALMNRLDARDQSITYFHLYTDALTEPSFINRDWLLDQAIRINLTEPSDVRIEIYSELIGEAVRLSEGSSSPYDILRDLVHSIRQIEKDNWVLAHIDVEEQLARGRISSSRSPYSSTHPTTSPSSSDWALAAIQGQRTDEALHILKNEVAVRIDDETRGRASMYWLGAYHTLAYQLRSVCKVQPRMGAQLFSWMLDRIESEHALIRSSLHSREGSNPLADSAARSNLDFDLQRFLFQAAYSFGRMALHYDMQKTFEPSQEVYDILMSHPEKPVAFDAMFQYIWASFQRRAPYLEDPNRLWTWLFDAMEDSSKSVNLSSRRVSVQEMEENDFVAAMGWPTYQLDRDRMEQHFLRWWQGIAGVPWEGPPPLLNRITPREMIGHLLLAHAFRRRNLPMDVPRHLLAAKPSPAKMGTLLPLLEALKKPQALVFEAILYEWSQAAQAMQNTEPRAEFLSNFVSAMRDASLLADSFHILKKDAALQKCFILPDQRSDNALVAASSRTRTAVPRQIANEVNTLLGTDLSLEHFQMREDLFRAIFIYHATQKGDLLRHVLGVFMTSLSAGQSRQQATTEAYRTLLEMEKNQAFNNPLWLQGIERRIEKVIPDARKKLALKDYLENEWAEALRHARLLPAQLQDSNVPEKIVSALKMTLAALPVVVGDAPPGAIHSAYAAAMKAALQPLRSGEYRGAWRQSLLKAIDGHLLHIVSRHQAAKEMQEQDVWVEVATDPIEILELGYPELGSSCLDLLVGSNRIFTQHYLTHLGVRVLYAYTVEHDLETGQPRRGNKLGRIAVMRDSAGRFMPISRIYSSTNLNLGPPFLNYIKAWADAMQTDFILPVEIKTQGGGKEIEADFAGFSDPEEVTFEYPAGPEGTEQFYSDFDPLLKLPSSKTFRARVYRPPHPGASGRNPATDAQPPFNHRLPTGA